VSKLAVVLSLACSLGLGLVSAAQADEAASLQFTVPAPDPVQAGDVLSFQALAVNVGGTAWAAGSYYWVADVYDLDFNFVARTDQVSPPTAVAAGAVAAVSLPFNVPETMSGRFLYRMSLIKDSKTLIQSEYKGFQIVAKSVPPPPQISTYAISGNIVQTLKIPNSDHGREANGTTNLNFVGKVRDTSYLFNTYILHQPGNVMNVYTIVGDVYAPWGTIHAGDVIPHLGTLAVDGQGMRGAILEQNKDRFFWTVAGGETITSQPGTVTTNGRFARTLYAGKFGADLGGNVKASFNGFTSQDEPGSLSSDPNSPNFQGPTLVAQKNDGYGLNITWQPYSKLKFSGDYQANQYFADISTTGVAATAYRFQTDWERKSFKLVAYIQKTGTNFVSFGAPAIIGDRLTYDANLNFHPGTKYKLMLSADQYRDNLSNNPAQVTTTQRVISMQHSYDVVMGTTLKLNGSLNEAVGNPSTALDNTTTVVGAGVTQAIKKQSLTVNAQESEFRDKTGLSDGLNTMTFGLSVNLFLPRDWKATLGLNNSQSSDIVNGSKIVNRTAAPSLTVPLSKVWTSQFWGVWAQTKNTNAASLANATDISLNSEFTWRQDKSFALTLGLGGNWNKDTVNPGNDVNSLTLSARYSYSF
jgi:hypothetical protein